jgi:hypothetical protein
MEACPNIGTALMEIIAKIGTQRSTMKSSIIKTFQELSSPNYIPQKP